MRAQVGLQRLADLDVPHFHRFRFQYTRQQAVVAAKAFLLNWLLESGFTTAVFLDADILVLAGLTPLFTCAAALTDGGKTTSEVESKVRARMAGTRKVRMMRFMRVYLSFLFCVFQAHGSSIPSLEGESAPEAMGPFECC